MPMSLKDHRTTLTSHSTTQAASTTQSASGFTLTNSDWQNLENAADATKYAKATIEAVAAYVAQQASIKAGYARCVIIDDIAGLRAKIQ